MRFFHLVLALLACVAAWAQDGWIRPASPDAPLTWGRRDGLVFGLPSSGGLPGPRGLIRVGVAQGKSGAPERVNFIAVEPVVSGSGGRFSRMGFSELEPSALDGRKGKRLSVVGEVAGELRTLPATANPAAQTGGVLTSSAPPPIQQLTVRIEVEPFSANGAHVYLLARMTDARPEEVELAVFHHPDSRPIEELTLTATMGNYERLRLLWLKDRVVDSRALYAGYQGNAFIEHENYPLEEMLRYGDGDALALCTTDEEDPGGAEVGGWTYRSVKLTQYWRMPGHDIQPDLRVKVNGRRVYWGSANTVPGGLAFENFELRQRYVPGQVFVFGLTRKAPWEFRPPIPRLARRPP